MSQKFSETNLPQHPEIEKAYNLFVDMTSEYLGQINTGTPEDDEDMAENTGSLDGMILETAQVIASLCQNKDPHIVAASLIYMPILWSIGERSRKMYEQVEKAVAPLTIEYACTFLPTIHPLFDNHVDVNENHIQAAGIIRVAMSVAAFQLFKKDPVKNEMALEFTESDPLCMDIKTLIDGLDLETAEPQLIATYEKLKKEVDDIQNGVTPPRSNPPTPPAV